MWHWPPLECERESREDPERGPLRSRPVSRILSRAAIHLARASGALRPCGLPGALRAASTLLLGLAPGGVCLAAASPRRRCALTAPFHPCRLSDSRAARKRRRFVSVALSRGFPRVGTPTTLPCGVRTFLEGPVVSPASPRLLGRPFDCRTSGAFRRLRRPASRIPRNGPPRLPPALRRGKPGTRRHHRAVWCARRSPAVLRA
jgi:hypothetical protein